MPLPRSFTRPSILARRKEEGRKEGPVSKRGSILSLRKRRTWRKMGRKEGGGRRYTDGWMEICTKYKQGSIWILSICRNDVDLKKFQHL